MYIHIEVPDIDEHPKGFPQFWLKRVFINSISTNYQVNALATTYVRLVEAALTCPAMTEIDHGVPAAFLALSSKKGLVVSRPDPA